MLVLVTIGTYMLSVMRTYLLDQKKLEVLTRANVIAGIDISAFDDYVIREKMETMPVENGYRAVILDGQSRVHYDSYSERSLLGKMFIYAPVTEVLSGSTDRSRYYQEDGHWNIEAAVPIIKNGKNIGAVLVMTDGDSIDALILRIQHAVYLFGAVMFVLVLLFGTSMASVVTAPIAQMTGFIKNMPKDKLQKCEISANDEVGELAVAFNDLIDRIAELEEKRRAFVSDASHELKTPLSIIKLLSDSMLQTPNPDSEFLREFLTDMNDEVERLTRIVERLLDLTRLDQTHNNLHFEMHSLTGLTETICEKLKPLAESKQITFTYTRPDADIIIPMDKDSLTEAVYNIADNSIKYTEPGGSVKIELILDLANVMVRISDTGIGIPKDEIQRIFDRFYRVDVSRARDTGGTGLGLSIALDVVKLHEGVIEVSSEEDKGSAFTIILPYHAEGDALPQTSMIRETIHEEKI